MKEYFSHDYNARNDKKLIKLFMKHGVAGIGVYWCIVEMLYEESGYLSIDEYERIAFELRVKNDVIKSVVENFDLFKNDNERFWSDSAIDRLTERMKKSEKARESVMKRWNKKNKNTNVLETNNDSNTSKVKESKVNNTWKNDFDIYLKDCKKAYKEFLNNKELMDTQQRLNPGVDLELTLEKGFINYWGTEAGWKKKKLSRSNEIDWKRTIINSISINKVYKK